MKILRSLASVAIQSTSLSAQEKASFLKNNFVPGKDYKFSTQILPKKWKKAEDAQVSKFWLDQHKWLVYSPSQQGGFCKYCVLFPPTTYQIKTGVLVSIPMKKFNKATGKIGYLAMHEQ